MDVIIRQVKTSEIPTVCEWANDPLFRSEFLAFGRDTDSVVAEKLQNLVHGTEETKYLAVERTADSMLIGLLFYYKVPYFDYFEVGFYIVPEERGKGYGTQAMRQLVKHIFETCRLEAIVAGTSSLNSASQRALKRAGFKEAGILRKTLFRNGQWEDSFVYQVVRDEWEKDDLKGEGLQRHTDGP